MPEVPEVRAEPVRATLAVSGCELHSATWGSGPASIVLLHDGLGSVRQWRSLPADVAALTGRAVLAYERAGHGRSRPVPAGPWPPDWLHREAAVLAALLEDQGLEDPILVGHSDGGSIALIHAAAGLRPAPRAVVALAAHSWVEQVCVDAITAMRANRDSIVTALARYHVEPGAVFEAWSGVWVSDDFRSWDIRPDLGGIDVPTLVLQGSDDSYATPGHAHETAAAIGTNAEARIVDGMGHVMHHDAPAAVAARVAAFVDEFA